MSPGDYVSIIEALYAIELPQREWLGHVARTSAAAIPLAHCGAYAITYDASDVNDCLFTGFASTGDVDERLAYALEFEFPETYRQRPQLVEAVLRRVAFAPSHELPMPEELRGSHEQLARFGVDHILGLNGVNVDGRGAHIGLLLPDRESSIDAELLARLSSHLAAAARLRQRLGDAPPLERADAILEANGTIAHAVGSARVHEARTALAAAARHLERLRGPSRRRDPEKAARDWRTLVRGEWSMVDYFDADGRRYILAQSNEPSLAPIDLLSQRERQVVALAAIGHSNKMIGYELGIAVSTVGVLLGRAARKLGTRKRRETMAAYAAVVAHVMNAAGTDETET
jgi:DNA-binding NarL/FixJ family response regulator